MQTVNAQHPPDSWKFPYPKAKSTLEFVHQEVTKVMSTDFWIAFSKEIYFASKLKLQKKHDNIAKKSKTESNTP